MSYLTIMGLHGHGDVVIPIVEETLSNYLFPSLASSWRGPVLPSRPCQFTPGLISKAYSAAGQLLKELGSMVKD